MPLADVALGPPVDRRGAEACPLELTPSEAVDPEAAACAGADGGPIVPGGEPAGTRPLVVVARREGDGRRRGERLDRRSGRPSCRSVWSTQPGDGVDGHLRAAWRSAAADRGAG